MTDKIKTTINTATLDSVVIKNFQNVTSKSLILPLIVLFSFFCFFVITTESTFVNTYVECQKYIFLELNNVLSIHPKIAYNITQLGDALVIFPFFFIFLIVAPKFWEVLLTSSIFTLIVSAVLKLIFAVPRPAAMIDMDTFTIMGRPNIMHTSLPSGHSMTAFMVITVLLYAFMPKKMSFKVIWSVVLILIGLTIGFSRVAVGAHYPIDVILGCAIGCIMAILSIRLNTNLNWLYWMKTRRFYPIIMLILSIWTYLVILKIMKHNMVIFYLSLIALVVTFFVITNKYVKKIKA